MNVMEKMLADGFGKNGMIVSPTIHLIQAGTGMGKTHFVIHALVPQALKEGKRLLYLCNRTALFLQVQQDIQNSFNDITNMRSPLSNGYYGFNTPPAICVQTYQCLESLISSGLDWTRAWGRFDYIVADECHYFLQDSMFNSYTVLSFEAIFTQRCQIFCMSATMLEFSNIIHDRVDYLRENSDCIFDMFLLIREHVIEDEFENINAVCFHETSEIISKINTGKKDEKWLVFVESKTLAKKLQDSIHKKTEIITADDKDSPEFKSIVQQENFNSDVLIATAVIDNGINIKDLNLRNLVLMTSEKTEFLQMLGRKRKASGEKITVYIQTLKEEVLKKRIRKLAELIDFGNRLFELPPEKQADIAIRYRNDWRSGYFICHRFNRLTGEICIILNHLAVSHCQFLLNEYQDMLKKIDENQTMSSLIPLSWIKKDHNPNIAWLNNIGVQILKGMLNIDFSKDELQEKIQALVPYVREYDKGLVQNGILSKQNFVKYLGRRYPDYTLKQEKSSDRRQRYRLEKKSK